MTSKKQSVSVVVLTKNSAATIGKCLDSVLSQTVKPDEIVVVDGASRDGTLEIVRKYPVRLVAEPGLGYGHARNVGVENSEGDIVFFIDSDCYAEPDWIEKMLPHFDGDASTAGVTGRLRLWNTEHGVARFLAYVGNRVNMPLTQGVMEIAPTMNLAVKRSVLREMGEFDPTLVRCEDTDMTYKISRRYKILYEPQAVVWFRGSPSLRIASRKCVNHFIGVGQLFAKHGFRKKFLRLNLPLRGLILFAAVASIFLTPWPVTALLFGVFFAEFAYKTVRMYWRYRDSSVAYYTVFFTFWSLASFAILYGWLLGLKNKNRGKTRENY